MAREPKSLFRRLTRLFRSGPIVKRKIRALDTTIAVADKTKSSGTLLFQKSLSPTYATITSNAYNLSERLMRYQDFQEMEYTPEIAAAMDIYADETCVAGDSMVHTAYGDYTISDLAKGVPELLKRMRQHHAEEAKQGLFPVYCASAGKGIVMGWAHAPRLTQSSAEVVRVTFDDGTFIRCTHNHRFMLRSGGYVRADELLEGDSLMPFKVKFMGRKGHEYPYIYTMNKQLTKSGWRAQHLFNYENLVGPIEPGDVVHHQDFDRTNHGIDNLTAMTAFSHSQYHARINNKNKFGKPNTKHSEWMLDNKPNAWVEPTLKEFTKCRGMSLDDVMGHFGITYSTLQAWVRKHGYANWQAFNQGKRTANSSEMKRGINSLSVGEIKKNYVLGDSKSDVVLKLGCTLNVFDKFLHRKLKTSWGDLVSTFGGQKLGQGGRPKGFHGSSVTYQDICNAVIPGTYMTKLQLATKLGTSEAVVTHRLVQNGFDSYTVWSEEYQNHKVVSVEPDGVADVYDLTVDQYHNFACNGVIVHNCAQDEKGRILHVYSDNEKVKELLEDLFYNVLNVEFNMRSWARNLCKYGDFFLYNDVSPEYGVINAFPIPVNEIEREENYDRDDPFAVRYRWVTLGNRTLENWEVTHFRLLGNDMFLPYGSSIIEPARRIWRQLILIEDAMLVYRVVRAPERRVFYIDVANLPPSEVNTYIEQQRQQMRTTPVVDRHSGRVDLRYNPMCLSLATAIALQDGRTLSLADLVAEWNAGKRGQQVYSIDPVSRRYVPGKVTWVGLTRKDAELVRVHLDDGSWLDVTPDHRFMLRDGGYQRADGLASGATLMPLYTRLSAQTAGDNIDGYEQVYDPGTETWVYTHRANVIAAQGFEALVGKVVHHVDHNKLNNDTSNLHPMTWADHQQHHRDCIVDRNGSDAGRAASSRRMRKTWEEGGINQKMIAELRKDPADRAKRSKALTLQVGDQLLEHCFRVMDAIGKGLSTREVEFIGAANADAELAAYFRQLNPNFKNGHVGKFTHGNLQVMMRKIGLPKSLESLKRAWLQSRYDIEEIKQFCAATPGCKRKDVLAQFGLPRNGFEELVRLSGCDLRQFRQTFLPGNARTYLNHSVVRVERLVAHEDTGCLTVERWHNFAAGGRTLDEQGNTLSSKSMILLHNSVEEDFFIPVRGGESGTKIDTLAGGQNTAAVEDVAYIQKKLFAALKIPRAYLGYDELLSCLLSNNRIRLADGTTPTVAELADRDWSEGVPEVHTISYDRASDNVVPGKINKVWKTKEVTQFHRVTLDDGTVLDVTENHPWLLRDGTYLRSDQLQVGQSLMPLYQRRSIDKKRGGVDLLNDYDMVWQPNKEKWEYLHKMVADQTFGNDPNRITRSRVVHHKDCNRLNNDPSNLQEMTWSEHRAWHRANAALTLQRPDVVAKREPVRIAALKSDKHRQKKSVQMTAQHADPNSKMSQWVHGDEISDVMSDMMTENWQDPDYRILKEKQNAELWEKSEYREKFTGDQHWSRKQSIDYDIEWLKSFCIQHGVTSINQWRSEHPRSVAQLSPVGFRRVHSLLSEMGYASWRDFAARELQLSVPKRGPDRGVLQSKFDIDDLRDFCIRNNVTLIGQWTPTHRNTVVELSPVSGTVVKRVLKEAGFTDFNQFRKTLQYNHKVASVEVIYLDTPVPVYDLEVEKYHNFAVSGENGPGFVFVHNSKATLAQEDIRFSRTINVIQKTMMAELNKLAIIHLYAHGFDGEDLQNFVLRLSNPSTVAQQQKLELWRAKFEIAGSAPEGMVSKKFIRKEVMGLNDEQMDNLDEERLAEKRVDEAIEAGGGGEGEAGSASGGGDDLFGGGGDEGEEPAAGGEAGGGTEKAPPPEENAGEEPAEETEPETELITGGDDPDDVETFALKLGNTDGQPVRPKSQLQKALYNRSRRRHHGASQTHTPDFVKMTGIDNHSMADPFDNDWLKSVVSNPFAEGTTHKRLRLAPDIGSTLRRMQAALKVSPRHTTAGVLTEAFVDVQDDIDRSSVSDLIDVDLSMAMSSSPKIGVLNEVTDDNIVIADGVDDFDTGDDE